MEAIHVDFENVVGEVRERFEHRADEECVGCRGDGECQEVDVRQDGFCPFLLFAGGEG